MTKPDGTVLLALMNGKFALSRRDLCIASLTLDPVHQLSRLDSRFVTARLPIRQDVSSTRHLPVLLRNRSIMHLSLGLCHKHRHAHRLCRHVWSTRLELFGSLDKAHHCHRP